MTPGDHRARRGEHPAVVMAGSGASRTYDELDDRSMRLARRLHAHGLRPGGCVAVMVENRTEWFDVFWAVMRSGAYLAPINHHLDAVESGAMIDDSGATVLVSSVALAEHTKAIGARRLANVTLRLTVGDDGEDELAPFPAAPLDEELAGEVMFYSGGTTGRPKTVIPPLSGAAYGERPHLLTALLESRLEFGPDSVLLVCAPLYHAGPLGFGAAVQRMGGTTVVMEAFEPEAALAAIERYGVTHALFVPMHLVELLALDDATRDRHDLSSLRVVVHGAGACPIPVKEAAIDWWGKIVHEYYVGSEANAFTLVSPDDWLEHKGTVGKPLTGVIHVCDADGHELPAGEAGQLWFEAGPQFEYQNDPASTAAAFDERGWSTIGDVGHVDDEGWLFITDRAADLVVLADGRTISPQTIEMALLGDPAVADAAVVVTDGVVTAHVVRRGDGHVEHPDVDRVIAVESLSRLPTGKLLKRLL